MKGMSSQWAEEFIDFVAVIVTVAVTVSVALCDGVYCQTHHRLNPIDPSGSRLRGTCLSYSARPLRSCQTGLKASPTCERS